MIDPRIYRGAFLPAIAALVALMFSLEPAPDPLEGPVSTPTFQGSETAALARTIAKRTPSRPPGSAGDRALADRVRRVFTRIEGAEVGSQTFEGEVEGETVELENVLLTLPGRREEVLVVVAGRGSPVGQGATTSASATAILMQMAADLGNARHERTIVLASIPGAGSGADPGGGPELIEELPAPAGIGVAIALAQPGVADGVEPFVIPGHAEPASIPPTLLETAESIGSVQFGTDANSAGPWQQLTRLALPVGVGEASALAAAGANALSVSGSGERPPPPDETAGANVSTESIFAVGSTALDLLLTLDERSEPLDAGPDAYVEIGGNLLPGWTLRLLALALVLPALLTAADVWLRDRRRDRRTASRALPWALERALLPLAALLAAYALGFVGLIPDPSYPFDPGRFEPGARGAITLAALAGAVSLAALLVRPMRTPLDVEPQTLAAAAGLFACLAVIGLWLLNPYLALLLAPTTHLWLLPARAQGPPRPGVIAAFAGLTLLPMAVASVTLAATLDLGVAGGTWYLLLLIAGGQFGLLVSLLWCLLLGSILACIAAGRGFVGTGDPVGPPPASVRGPGGHAGPGSLGGTPSGVPSR